MFIIFYICFCSNAGQNEVTYSIATEIVINICLQQQQQKELNLLLLVLQETAPGDIYQHY